MRGSGNVSGEPNENDQMEETKQSRRSRGVRAYRGQGKSTKILDLVNSS